MPRCTFPDQSLWFQPGCVPYSAHSACRAIVRQLSTVVGLRVPEPCHSGLGGWQQEHALAMPDMLHEAQAVKTASDRSAVNDPGRWIAKCESVSERSAVNDPGRLIEKCESRARRVR